MIKYSFLFFAVLIVLFSFAGSAGATVQADNWDDLRQAVIDAGVTPTTIEIMADFNSAGGINTAAILIPAGSDITITSNLTAFGAPFTLTQLTANQRHFDVAGGTLRLENITLDGGSPPFGTNRGGIVVRNQVGNVGRLYLEEGGRITNNRGNMGGAVDMHSGTIIMNGGEISGNIARDWGGAVRAFGTIIMNGGEISGNTAGIGGGVYLQQGHLMIYGGTISGNAAGTGGGVRIGANNHLILDGGEISGNRATRTDVGGNGGAV